MSTEADTPLNPPGVPSEVLKYGGKSAGMQAEGDESTDSRRDMRSSGLLMASFTSVILISGIKR